MKSFYPATFLISTCLLLCLATGCGPEQPAFDTLHPVTGKITYGGQQPQGGVLQLKPLMDTNEFMINAIVAADGSFELTTVRATDTRGERRQGVPAGEYHVTFIPPLVDQTVSFEPPVTLPKTVTIEPKANVLTLDVPKPKTNP